MISRYFTIKNFRNIGCCEKGTDVFTNFAYHLKAEDINYRDKLSSGVNILIGENNIGKTNVLDALRWFCDPYSYNLDKGEMTPHKKDFPRFNEDCNSYEVSCVVRDGKKGDEGSVSATLTRKIKKGATKPTSSVVFSDGFTIDDYEWYVNFPRFLNNVYADAKLVPQRQNFVSYVHECPYVCSSYSDNLKEEIWKSYCTHSQMNPNESKKNKKTLFDELDRYVNINNHNNGMWKDLLDCINPPIIYFNQSLINNFETSLDSQTKITKYSLYGPISLNIPYCIFGYLNIKYDDELLWSESASDAELKVREKEINEKLSTLNDMFNSVFTINKLHDNFKFVMHYEQGRIETELHKNNVYMDIKEQSSAFQWFLTFYLYIVAYNNATPYSIILLDEPCTALSLQTTKEVKKVINEIAEKYKLTFLIATHSPSLIDMDHLEEVRILERDGQNVIANGFFNDCHRNKDDESDLLKPILAALTAEYNILYNSTKNRVIFCEGISDYLYLAAYKEHFKKEGYDYNLVFVPLNGISNDYHYYISLMSDLVGPSILLVDGDGEGKALRDCYKEHGPNKEYPYPVIGLDDVCSSFGKIETLFSSDDLDLFDIDPRQSNKDNPYWKRFIYSTGIKMAIMDDKTNSLTNDNFRTVLNYLSDGNFNIIATFEAANGSIDVDASKKAVDATVNNQKK